MKDTESTPIRTDGLGREFVCETKSPDSAWHIQIFGPNEYSNSLYAHARHSEHGGWLFGLGRELVNQERISFRWDLPNGSWGIFIDLECWAIYTYRPVLRIRQHRIFSRSGPRTNPYTEEEIRFICAKRRGQRKGQRGFIIEE